MSKFSFRYLCFGCKAIAVVDCDYAEWPRRRFGIAADRPCHSGSIVSEGQ